MQAGGRTNGITYSARNVGGGAGSGALATEQRPPRTFLQRGIEPCTHYRSAELVLVATAGWALAACNVARYDESSRSGTRDCDRCTCATTLRGLPAGLAARLRRSRSSFKI